MDPLVRKDDGICAHRKKLWRFLDEASERTALTSRPLLVILQANMATFFWILGDLMIKDGNSSVPSKLDDRRVFTNNITHLCVF